MREASSGAFGVLQACGTREMVGGSHLMTHEPRATLPGMVNRVELDFYRMLLMAMTEEWNALCNWRLRITPAQYSDKVKGKDWVMGSAEALSVGAVDTVF